VNETAWLPQIDALACTGCGDCLKACPTGALALRAGKAVVAQPSACSYDAGCEAVCPTGAIALPYLIVFGTPPGAAAG
jgi:NAD-dependent dihydropyrimidine dehydrogenase PreA subunit